MHARLHPNGSAKTGPRIRRGKKDRRAQLRGIGMKTWKAVLLVFGLIVVVMVLLDAAEVVEFFMPKKKEDVSQSKKELVLEEFRKELSDKYGLTKKDYRLVEMNQGREDNPTRIRFAVGDKEYLLVGGWGSWNSNYLSYDDNEELLKFGRERIEASGVLAGETYEVVSVRIEGHCSYWEGTEFVESAMLPTAFNEDAFDSLINKGTVTEKLKNKVKIVVDVDFSLADGREEPQIPIWHYKDALDPLNIMNIRYYSGDFAARSDETLVSEKSYEIEYIKP